MEVWPKRTSSKMKNSASGPKYAVSAIPVCCRYATALRAMLRGSRVYGSRVIVSMASAVMLSVVTMGNGSMNAVAGSRSSSMSLDSIDFQPRMDDPSKPTPASKVSSSNSAMGMQKCCHVPRKSQNLMSTS